MADFKELFEKYLKNSATPLEIETLMVYFHADRDEELDNLVFQELDNPDVNDEKDAHHVLLNEVYVEIVNRIGNKRRSVRRLWPRIAAAASILLFLSVGIYYAVYQLKQNTELTVHNKILPGGKKAVLTLADGKQLFLNDAANGRLSSQGNSTVRKVANGQVSYEREGVSKKSSVFNTMTTPRGGEYRLTLSDGTKVWLNAESSIHYPTSFTGSDRVVDITGEVYFEVAHNAAMPFKVLSKGQTIQVLGTHFNVDTYDAAIKTTLLQGSVRVSARGTMTMLKPGQQANWENDTFSVSEVDTEEVTAWTNGYFQFDNEGIESIMRKISLWYDVSVTYEGDFSKLRFGGIVSRSKSIQEALNVMQSTNSVHFKIEGRRITVTK